MGFLPAGAGIGPAGTAGQPAGPSPRARAGRGCMPGNPCGPLGSVRLGLELTGETSSTVLIFPADAVPTMLNNIRVKRRKSGCEQSHLLHTYIKLARSASIPRVAPYRQCSAKYRLSPKCLDATQKLREWNPRYMHRPPARPVPRSPPPGPTPYRAEPKIPARHQDFHTRQVSLQARWDSFVRNTFLEPR